LADASGGNLPLAKSAVSDDSKIANGQVPQQVAEKTTDSEPVTAQDATPAQTEHTIAASDAPPQPTDDVAAEQSVEQTIDRAAAMVEAAPVQLDAPQPANEPATETTAAAAARPAEPAAPAPKLDLAAVPEAKPNPASETSAPVAGAPGRTATAPATDPNDIPTVVAPKRTGHVAVFISRKDRRLYVRQNFSPVFDVPVTINDPDKPFGTFVFTAHGDKEDVTALHWSVVAMPYAIKRTVTKPPARSGKRAKSIVETSLAAPPATAADALDRITVPDWALQRVAEAIKPGGSLIISDHGLGDETGEGTDFIVPLR
jgi:hypothetical protein